MPEYSNSVNDHPVPPSSDINNILHIIFSFQESYFRAIISVTQQKGFLSTRFHKFCIIMKLPLLIRSAFPCVIYKEMIILGTYKTFRSRQGEVLIDLNLHCQLESTGLSI